MRKKCIIHIGMHKTGSSSIQETLNHHEGISDFQYADFKTSNHSGKILSIFLDSSERRLDNLKRRGMSDEEIKIFIENAKKLLIKNCEDKRSETMILSGEGIVGLSLESLYKLKIFLQQYFENIDIVAYIRTPISFMQSAFQQQIKEGRKEFSINRSFPKYKSKFEKFDEVFGKSNVLLWKFEPKTFRSNDVVHDFCYRLGIDVVLGNVSRHNETISKEALSLLYIYRKYGQGFGVGPNVVRENNLLIEALTSIGNGKIEFSKQLTQGILEKIKDDIAWMESRLGESLEEKYIYGNLQDEFSLLQIQPDVIEKLRNLLTNEYIPCGLNGDTYKEIAILVHCLRIKLSKKNLINEEIAKSEASKMVLKGRKGYLFLVEGNHNIIDLYMNKRSPKKSSIENFSNNILNRSRYCQENDISYKHFIFPDKLFALNHLHDFAIKSLYQSKYMNYNKEVNNNVTYFNFDENKVEGYYNKTDTHINLYGNLALLKEIIPEDNENIKFYIDKVKNNIRLKTGFMGDLGVKLIPKESESVVKYRADDNIIMTTNGLQKGNNGKLDILINDKAVYNKKILIFGDSFFRSMLKDISYFYSEVIHCRSPFFHTEIVKLCQPDIIYTGQAERYLSNVSLDEDRYDFFTWPLILERDLLPDKGFGKAMLRVFNFNNKRVI